MLKNSENQRYNLVIKSNDLIQKTRFSLNVEQQKLILYLISKIKPDDIDFYEYEFSIIDYFKITGTTKGGNTYRIIEEGLQTLADKSMYIYDDNGIKNLVRWLQKVRINEKHGTIIVRFDEDLKPYLLQLKEKFTQYELIYTFCLKSKYSLRAYEYFTSRHYDKLKSYSFKMSIDEFKERVGAESYDLFKNLNTRVIKPIVKEINQYTDKMLTIEPITEKRKVTALNITLASKDVTERRHLRSVINRKLNGNQLTFDDIMGEELLENE